METTTYKTAELARSGRDSEYNLWFLTEKGRVEIEMSLSGLFTLAGLVERSIERLKEANVDEMNGHSVPQQNRVTEVLAADPAG